MKQKYAFLESEGNAWFSRNQEKLAAYSIETDPVISAMRAVGMKPRRVIEFGCGDGRRLAALREAYGCEIMGVEPSMKAGLDAASRRVPVVQASASSPPISGTFDLVIYGFCLYLTDPDDWLTIAAEGDKLLDKGGHLIIHDFYAYHVPSARRYEHRDGVLSYHFDFACLWLGNPLYTVVCRNIDGDHMVTVLKKTANSIRVLP